jgi:hypothetical protein
MARARVLQVGKMYGVTWDQLAELEPELTGLLKFARMVGDGCRKRHDVERGFNQFKNDIVKLVGFCGSTEDTRSWAPGRQTRSPTGNCTTPSPGTGGAPIDHDDYGNSFKALPGSAACAVTGLAGIMPTPLIHPTPSAFRLRFR